MTLRRILLAFFGLFFAAYTVRAAATPAPPKLVVVISIDQLRADYLVRFRPYFVEGGFKRLLEGGTVFENANYRHSLTVTAPGHAQILSGAFSRDHSIISNEWFDLDSGEIVNSVEDRGSPLVGIDPREMGPVAARNPQKTGRSPKNFHSTTVGDELKKRYGDKSRVISLSNKDRSAILLGGQKADGVYWDEIGRFITSRYYRADLPAWIVAFNAEKRAEAVFDKTWERLLDPAIYDRVQGPDDVVGETTGSGFTRTFPKRMDGGETTITPKFFDAYDWAPFTTEALGELAQRALVAERLGQHEATDLLAVGFSQIDAVGHTYGPDSHEVMDSVLRLDRVLAAFFDRVNREVGLTHCLIVLTADHGVAPMPEIARDHPAGRVNAAALDDDARRALNAAYGPLPANETWFVRENFCYHFRPAALAAKSISAAAAAIVVQKALRLQPPIAEAYTREELLAAEPTTDSILDMTRRSYNAGRGRDLVVILKPYYFSRAMGSTHGSPYDYDTHVPMLWFGAGIPRSVRPERVGVDDLAPTLSALLGLPAPPQAKGRRLF